MQKLASHVNAHLRAIAAPALHRRVAELRASGTMAPTFEPDYVEPEYVQCPQYSCEFRAVLPTEIMPFHIYSAHGGVYSTVPCNDGENFTIREIRNPTFSAPRSGSSATEVLTDNHTTSHEWTCTNVDRESLDDDYSLGDYFRVSGLNFDTVNDSGLGGSTNSCPVNGCGLGGALAWSTHAWNTGYPDDTDAGLQWALISSVHDFGLRPAIAYSHLAAETEISDDTDADLQQALSLSHTIY